MEILGVGPTELLFILIIAIIVLGPRDMQKAGRTVGKWLRQIVTSDGWKLFQQTSREIQTLPNRLMREAALDELKEVQKDLRQSLEPDRRDATLPQVGASQPTVPPGARPTPDTQVSILPTPPDSQNSPPGEKD